MIKLSDTQAVLLSSASQRTDGSLLPLPASIATTPRIGKSLAGLVTRGFAEERATDVTDAVHRTDGDLRFGLFLTPAGEAAIGIEQADAASDPTPQSAAVQPIASDTPQPSPRQPKAALVLDLLTRVDGATLPELIAATGWLPHTTRAALTGLRKKGHEVTRGKRDGVTCYTVIAATAGDR